MVWFWYFLIYSFLGFLVEVAYVRLVGGVKRDRKCRLVLPICPVYGLGALAILLLPPLVRDSLPLLFPAAALVCTAGEQPGFVLAYLNASQNSVHLLAVPAGLQVTFADEDAALADCYTAAGPARCRQALMECLPLPEDTRYLALSEAVLERITARYGPVRVGFSGAMTAGELARYGRDSRVQGLSAAEAHGFLTGMDADAVVPQAHRAAARGAVWDAFFRQNLDLLPGALPQALRSVSASLLTDLTALDLDTLDRTLEFLANNEAQIETQVLPGDEQAGRYTLNEESLAAVQSFFNVSPTDGQASSASEP